MAAIVTDEDFALAVGWLVEHGQLPVTGERQVIPSERKVYDAVPNPTPPPGQLLTDITPSQAILEAALDDALAAQQVEADREAARQLLVQAKEYIRTQLESSSPSTAQQQVAVLLPYVSGGSANAFLTSRMTKLIGLANTAYGWSLVISPAAAPNYQRWLEVFIQMVSIET